MQLGWEWGWGEVKLVLENCGLVGAELAFNTKVSGGRGGEERVF